MGFSQVGFLGRWDFCKWDFCQVGFWSDGNMVNGIFSRWDFFQVGNRNAPYTIIACKYHIFDVNFDT